MRRSTAVAMLLAGGAIVCAQEVVWAQGRGPRIIEYAPTDHSVAIPKETLDQYLKDMDADDLATLRMIEGGKFNVNIRRIRNAETALSHPNTIDLWVIIEGSGTMTTGGQLIDRQIVNGVSYPLKMGDVVFIPNGTPHGVSGVDGNITWLNIRWDTDWPADAQLGAGNYQGPAGSRGRLSYAGAGAIYIPKQTLDIYMRDMAARDIGTLRMIEGGHFNVNIRRQETPSGTIHPNTIDTWVVLEGGGTVITDFDRTEVQSMVPGTGVTAPGKVGDVFFHPPNLMHGWSEINNVATWLNIRWDTNWNYRFPTR